jgi:hypothetical protein
MEHSRWYPRFTYALSIGWKSASMPSFELPIINISGLQEGIPIPDFPHEGGGVHFHAPHVL